MSDKKYSDREVAIAVLKKAEEMIKAHKHIGWNKLHSKLEGEGYSKESADKIDGAIKAKVEKSEIDHKGKEVAPPDGIQHQEQPSKDPLVAERDNNASTAAGEVSRGGILKGPIKLAKFMGRMEHKRSVKAPEGAEMDKGETGHEKGVHAAVDKRLTGISMAGGNLPAKGDKEVLADSKKEHHKVMAEQKAMPKPKLPK